MTKALSELQTVEHNLAALDIGSNSFHFVLARVIDGHLQIIHSEKYQVKLAAGLNKNNELDQEAIDRAINVLSNLATTVKNISEENFRIVATFSLRQAKNAQAFLTAAAKVFPFDIEIISGHEEARLIYQGVAHYSAPDKQQLVIDIGGGSTECVIGKNFKVLHLASLNIGCVSFMQRYFNNGLLTQKAFEQAILDARLELEALSARFTKTGWQITFGASGTIKSIYQIINENNDLSQAITLKQLQQLKKRLITLKHIDNIDFNSLKNSRKTILAPGLAILIAIFEMLEIKQINYCDYALREGVLFELLEQKQHHDSRELTIASLQSRFNVDIEQAQQVAKSAQYIFDMVNENWSLKPIYRSLMTWAALSHEIGFDINPSGHHKHGQYIMQNADLAGFNQEQSQALCYLVGNQRKKITPLEQYNWYLLKPKAIGQITALMRLAVLLNQQRQLTSIPSIRLTAHKNALTIFFPTNWLTEKTLIKADLDLEQEKLKTLNIKLIVKKEKTNQKN